MTADQDQVEIAAAVIEDLLSLLLSSKRAAALVSAFGVKADMV